MSTNKINNPLLHGNRSSYIRFSLSSVVAIGLAILIIWALVSSSDPEVTISSLTVSDRNMSTINITVSVSNPNYFRGFNYTWTQLSGQIRSDDHNYSWTLRSGSAIDHSSNKTWEYQGFKKPLQLNFTVYRFQSLSSPDSAFTMMLKKQKGCWFYLSLELLYTNKILFWTTTTTLDQWLDTNVFVTDDLTLKNGGTRFKRITNFSFAFDPWWIPN